MEDTHPLMRIGITLGIIILSSFLFFYREEETIVIENRWWISTTSVQYDETRLVTECYPETTCSGYGDDRICSTETKCTLVSKTFTYTRCSDTRSGDSLPVVYPESPCTMLPGDYLTHTSAFFAAYHVQEEDKTKSSPFVDRLWNSLEPKDVVRIKKNILGIIVDAEIQ